MSTDLFLDRAMNKEGEVLPTGRFPAVATIACCPSMTVLEFALLARFNSSPALRNTKGWSESDAYPGSAADLGRGSSNSESKLASVPLPTLVLDWSECRPLQWR